MKLKELLQKYKEMPLTQRRLLLIAPPAVFLFALMTAPHNPSSAGETATLFPVPDCAVTKMSMSIFGRSLVSYDRQSGNCFDATPRSRKVGP